MIEPVLSDDAFLADVAACRGAEGFRLWWLGQSGFLLQWRDRCLIFDPYLSDSLTLKYANTDKPHVRMTRRVVDPARLKFVDVATCSHGHTDHLDAETLISIIRAKDPHHEDLFLVLPAAVELLAWQRFGKHVPVFVPMDALEEQQLPDWHVAAVPAAHEKVDLDTEGRHLYLGYVVRFGPWAIYHSGDTVLYDGMVDLLRTFKIDVALLPINGRSPERRIAGNLNGREAARLAKEIEAKLVIPCHYEMFQFNTADPREEFIPECERLGQPYKVLRAGERWASSSAFPLPKG